MERRLTAGAPKREDTTTHPLKDFLTVQALHGMAHIFHKSVHDRLLKMKVAYPPDS